MAQDTATAPIIHIDNYNLEVVSEFTYLGSTMSSNLSFEPELSRRIGKASAVLSCLYKPVWENKKLTLNTKMKVYQACILSTLLYGSETWPTYSVQERCLNSVHQRHLRTIMNVTWKDHVSNHDILAKGKIPSLHALISQKRLLWLGHVTRMEDGQIPKDMLYSELCRGTRPQQDPQADQHFDSRMSTMGHESLHHRHIILGNCCPQLGTWRKITCDGMKKNDEKRQHKWQEKRNQPPPQPSADPALKCNNHSKSVDQGLDFTATGYAVLKMTQLRRICSHHCQK